MKKAVTCDYVQLLSTGEINYENLELKLKESKGKTLVSLMHANNEIGILLDLQRVGELCNKYDAVFHSDCVQTVGHYPLDLGKVYIQFISAASHKFHGPKGIIVLKRIIHK